MSSSRSSVAASSHCKSSRNSARAVRLLLEASAQILYLIAHRRGKRCRRLVQHQPATFRTGISPGCLNTSQLNGLWNCARAQRQSIFRLDVNHSTRNECRRDSPLRNPFEFRRCCDAAFWHPACSGRERRHSFLRPSTQIGLRKKFGCAAYIASSNSERSGIVRWKNNGTGNDSH